MHRILNLTLFCICYRHLLPLYMARSELTDQLYHNHTARLTLNAEDALVKCLDTNDETRAEQY